MALFGLSPLFLSFIASEGFTSPTTGLDVMGFLNFMAIFTGSIHLIGAFTLRTPDLSRDLPMTPRSDISREANEDSCLLPGRLSGGKAFPDHSSIVEFLSDPCFWILAVILLVTAGSVSSY